MECSFCGTECDASSYRESYIEGSSDENYQVHVTGYASCPNCGNIVQDGDAHELSLNETTNNDT